MNNLIPDVLLIIFESFSIHDLLSALQVNRHWCQVAIPLYWKAPFNYTSERSRAALRIYKLFLEESDVDRKKPLYDYPSFIKELNCKDLLISEVDEMLPILIKYEARLDTFIINFSSPGNDRIYVEWTKSCYKPIFDSLVHIEISTPFLKNVVLQNLAENCTQLSHLDINLYDNRLDRFEGLFDYLNQYISAQKHLLNLRLVFKRGDGEKLINVLRSKPKSFKRLELVGWNFYNVTWEWLKNCSNLDEFAITSPAPKILSKIFEVTPYETIRTKYSNVNKIVTIHWHIKDGSKFYFHQDES
ncbi:18654_t:CDS:2, partial [Acaulospora morrowiae]